MIDVQCNGVEFMAQVDVAMAEIDKELDKAYFNWTLHVFQDLVMLYPQWSGDAVSNWRYSIHSPSGEYTKLYTKDLRWGAKGYASEPPVQRGNFEAVSIAMSRAMDGPRPSYEDAVYFVNNTPIAADLEDNPAWVRPINLVNGVVATAQFIADKWRNLPYDASNVTFP